MFQYYLKQGTIIYRGTDNPELHSKSTWFAFDEQTARRYNKKIHKYTLNQDVKCINIMSHLFHQDYLDKLNMIYKGDDNKGLDIRKFDAAIPIGLPSLDEQIRFLASINVNLKIGQLNPTQHAFNAFLNGKHRYSTYDRDMRMATLLSKLYPEYKGFASLIEWPSVLMDGMFNREICLFTPNECLTHVQLGGRKRQIKVATKQHGCTSKPKDEKKEVVNIPSSGIEGDSWNRHNDHYPEIDKKIIDEINALDVSILENIK